MIKEKLLILVFALGTLLSCVSNQNTTDNRVYNSLESMSLLNIPEEFLPSSGNCKVWFPDYAIDKQPFSSSCKSSFMERSISQIFITNEGTDETPVYSVLEMIKAKEGFTARTLYFKNI
ncbi:MAG: hypothetical protein CMC70_10340 [Flavobacteriaceae bacterium]|nr:hypothetical protein [Flavobacteriaceae bacterium]|tara:strand:+ start:171 stop:527 length:357 start_codon:yes stop_codon:yes gene_type:complete